MSLTHIETDTFNPALMGEVDDDFNMEAARDAYEAVMSMDDEELPYALSVALFDSTTKDLAVVGKQLRHDYLDYQLGEVRKQKQMLAKRWAQNPTADAEAAFAELTTVEKAYVELGKDSAFEQQMRVKHQWRDQSGRFRIMHRGLDYDSKKPAIKTDRQREQLGYGAPPISLRGVDRAYYDQASAQVHALLDDVRNIDPDAVVTLHTTDGTAYSLSGTGGEDARSALHALFSAGQLPRSATVDANQSAPGAQAFDALSALKFPHGAAVSGGSMVNNLASNNKAVGNFADSFTGYSEAVPWTPTTRTYNRLSAGADLADTIYPAGPKLKAALKAAKWAGKHGSEVERVVGPSFRRSGYRYRGVEKKPTEGLQRSVHDAVRRHNGDTSAARKELIYGRTDEHRRQNGSIEREQIQSPVISYFQNQLPKAELVDLQNASGTVPPSRGIIIDRQGRVVAEAAGHGDDHYLPFNLKNMGRLKGGEYIRTRTLGGPTTEDIYAGLVSGARAVTVVSRSGVYTVEFDDTFRGNRRYNDHAAKMVARYGLLLDALKNGNVSLADIPKDRRDEIEAQAVARYGSDDATEQARHKFITRATDEELRKPTMSADYKNELASDFLAGKAEAISGESDFTPLVEHWAATNGITEPVPMSQVASSMYGRDFASYMEGQQKTYEAEHKPLTLNGKGYDSALVALQEQFPYYIKSVNYRPLSDKTAMTGRSDTGYIKPRYIRPEGVKSGYFDPSIQGFGEDGTTGKVRGDRTNYQNGQIWRSEHYKATAKTAGGTLNPVAATAVGTPTATVIKPPGAPDPEAEGNALVALVNHIKTVPKGLPGTPFADVDPKYQTAVTDKHPLLFGDAEELRIKHVLEPVSTRQAVNSELASLRMVMPIDSALVAAWNNKGAAPEAKPFNAAQFLLNPTQPYGFGGNADLFLRPNATKEQYETGYGAEEGFAQGAKLVGATGLNDPDAVKKADAFIATLRSAQAQHNRWKANGMVGDRGMSPDDIELQARQVAMFRNLAAHYAKVGGAAPKAPAPSPAPKPVGEGKPVGERQPEKPPPAPERTPSEAKEIDMAKVAALRTRIDDMVGMETIGREVDGLFSNALSERRRKAAGLPVEPKTYHMIFTGAPGTGKTTVAKEMAPLYNELGLLPNNTFMHVDRGDLVGEYAGQTAPKVRSLFNKARGGVLFIDEAYNLKNSPDDYLGQEAINTLMDQMEQHRDDTVVILAGYQGEMDHFLTHNPGLSSRFPKRMHFPNYDAKALQTIMDRRLGKGGYVASKGSAALLKNAAQQIALDPGNANARDVRNLYDSIVGAQEARLAKVENPTHDQLRAITTDDIRVGMASRNLEVPTPRKRKPKA